MSSTAIALIILPFKEPKYLSESNSNQDNLNLHIKDSMSRLLHTRSHILHCSSRSRRALNTLTGVRISPGQLFVRLSNDFVSCARTQCRYLPRRKNGGAMRTPDWGGARIRDRFLSLWTPHRRSTILAGVYKQLPVSLATYIVAREMESYPDLELFDLQNIVKIGVFRPRCTSYRPRTRSELRISRQCAV